MVDPFRGPRKQRTREHVIADLSVHHVEGFILEEGHTTQRLGSDYGYDLLLWTFDEHGYAEPGSIYFQFKAGRHCNRAEQIMCMTWTFGITTCGFGRKCLSFLSCLPPPTVALIGWPSSNTSTRT